jgi:hypothetical protein
MGGTREYHTRHNMIRRCTNPNEKSYVNYGGRGVTVCARYRESFEEFFKDLGRKPHSSHSIDRIDNNGNYSCGKCAECVANGWTMNVRWADKITQGFNKRKRENTASQYAGVRRSHSKSERWCAAVYTHAACNHLGSFATEEEAARARDRAVIELGIDAPLNFPDEAGHAWRAAS